MLELILLMLQRVQSAYLEDGIVGFLITEYSLLAYTSLPDPLSIY